MCQSQPRLLCGVIIPVFTIAFSNDVHFCIGIRLVLRSRLSIREQSMTLTREEVFERARFASQCRKRFDVAVMRYETAVVFLSFHPRG